MGISNNQWPSHRPQITQLSSQGHPDPPPSCRNSHMEACFKGPKGHIKHKGPCQLVVSLGILIVSHIIVWYRIVCYRIVWYIVVGYRIVWYSLEWSKPCSEGDRLEASKPAGPGGPSWCQQPYRDPKELNA